MNLKGLYLIITNPIIGYQKLTEIAVSCDVSMIQLRIKNNNEDKLNIAYCPERVLPGQVVKELVGNDRIIGGITEKCSILASQFYKILVLYFCLKNQ